MDISNLYGVRSYCTAAVPKQEEKPLEAEEKTAARGVSTEQRDTFVKSTAEKPVTYSKNQLTSAQAKQLQEDQEQRIASFQRMLESMIVKQGEKSNLSLFGLSLNVTASDSAAAAAAIADGGEYSVDAVATRLLDMAKALSGGDASKIGELRAAVQKGFEAAGVKLGGTLPGICQDTYTEVMKRFDDWERESKTEVSAE